MNANERYQLPNSKQNSNINRIVKKESDFFSSYELTTNLQINLQILTDNIQIHQFMEASFFL